MLWGIRDQRRRSSSSQLCFQMVMKSLRRSIRHTRGKRLLIPAKVLYSGRVPFGQEDHLFQYSVLSVNSDHKSLVTSYDERCISNCSDVFQDFLLYDVNKETINSYPIKYLKENHELYHIHLGLVNKKVNDKREEDCIAEEAKKNTGAEDLPDILLKIQNKIKPSHILLEEFEPIGELQPHVITRGPCMGETSFKQLWQHCYSNYQFTWHRVFGKEVFASGKLLKAARAIISQKCQSQEHLELILKHDRKDLIVGCDKNGW